LIGGGEEGCPLRARGEGLDCFGGGIQNLECLIVPIRVGSVLGTEADSKWAKRCYQTVAYGKRDRFLSMEEKRCPSICPRSPCWAQNPIAKGTEGKIWGVEE